MNQNASMKMSIFNFGRPIFARVYTINTHSYFTACSGLFHGIHIDQILVDFFVFSSFASISQLWSHHGGARFEAPMTTLFSAATLESHSMGTTSHPTLSHYRHRADLSMFFPLMLNVKSDAKTTNILV